MERPSSIHGEQHYPSVWVLQAVLPGSFRVRAQPGAVSGKTPGPPTKTGDRINPCFHQGPLRFQASGVFFKICYSVKTKRPLSALAAFLLTLAWLAAGCASPVKGLFRVPRGQTPRTIYVLHRGLHTGVIIRAVDIPSGIWPEHWEYPNAEYLEVGWGDSRGYRYPLTCGIAFRAMFESKASVLLIHAFIGSVTNEYAGIAKEIIAVRLSTRGFARLCAYIQSTYVLGPRGRPIALPSAYFDENFFLAHDHYSAVNNCNNWTARALRAAGCPIRPRWSLFPGSVMRQTRRFGRVIWPKIKSDNPDRLNGPNRRTSRSIPTHRDGIAFREQ